MTIVFPVPEMKITRYSELGAELDITCTQETTLRYKTVSFMAYQHHRRCSNLLVASVSWKTVRCRDKLKWAKSLRNVPVQMDMHKQVASFSRSFFKLWPQQSIAQIKPTKSPSYVNKAHSWWCWVRRWEKQECCWSYEQRRLHETSRS